MGLSNLYSCDTGSFSCCCNPHRFFSVRGFEALFSRTGALVVGSVSLPSCSSQFIHMQMWDRPLCQLAGPPATTWSQSSPPLLPVWMNVSSLTPWLLDFHTVRFSGNSGYFVFLNLLLSFLWLCEEAKYIYLHLHLGSLT